MLVPKQIILITSPTAGAIPNGINTLSSVSTTPVLLTGSILTNSPFKLTKVEAVSAKFAAVKNNVVVPSPINS